jgi:formate/nitrite transporter FocA (FNT family)
MTAGLGRPLILTTLERDEAMRILASDAPRRPLAAAIAFAVGLVAVTFGLAWAIIGLATQPALAASPSPSSAIGGDPRSSGQGPGLVGDPLFAIGLMLAIGLGAALLTTLYVRLTGGRRA